MDDSKVPGPPSERSRIRRLAEKAAYDRPTIDAILDEGLVAHVGLTSEDGSPVVVPTAYVRDGDRVLFHGSVASRLVRTSAGGAEVCLTVTLLDALVVARSLFESSMAYRSVVVRGRAVAVDDPEEKRATLLTLSERLLPGRVAEARGPNDRELAQTRVLALPLDEASAKVSGPEPDDGPDDVALPIWAGWVPVALTRGDAVAAADLRPGIDVAESVRNWHPRR